MFLSRRGKGRMDVLGDMLIIWIMVIVHDTYIRHHRVRLRCLSSLFVIQSSVRMGMGHGAAVGYLLFILHFPHHPLVSILIHSHSNTSPFLSSKMRIFLKFILSHITKPKQQTAHIKKCELFYLFIHLFI